MTRFLWIVLLAGLIPSDAAPGDEEIPASEPAIKFPGDFTAKQINVKKMLFIGNEKSPKSQSEAYVTVEGDLSAPSTVVGFNTMASESIKINKVLITRVIAQAQGKKSLEIKSKFQVHGDVEVKGSTNVTADLPDANQTQVQASFLEELVVAGTYQYVVVDHEGLGRSPDAFSKGWRWSDQTKPFPANYGDASSLYLEACPSVAQGTSPLVVSKNFELDDVDSQSPSVEVAARIHFLNGGWDGRVAFMKVDEEVVWMESYDSQAMTDAMARDRYSQSINVVFKPKNSSFKITFGSTLSTGEEVSNGISSSAVAALCPGPAWGVDDITISIRK